MQLIHNKQKSLDKLNLLIKIRETVNINTVMGAAILNAYDSDDFSLDDILSFISEQSLDNPDLMATILSEDLVNKILNIKTT